MESDASAAEANRTKAVTKLWRSYRTALQMCRDRGYELTDDECNMSLDDFRRYKVTNGVVDRSKISFTANPSEEMAKKHLPLPTQSNPNPMTEAGTIWVEFMSSSETFGVSHIKEFIKSCAERQIRNGIMITHAALSPSARKLVSATQSYTNIECFLEEDLEVNITHHVLVPKHILLSREEKAALLKRYRLKETQLPRITQRDPISRYLGLKRGNIVKIIRSSDTAGRYASYRLCV